jgi:hypothetical protein
VAVGYQNLDNPDALDHLANVLTHLSDLRKCNRWPALDDALAFYNAARPEARIEPIGGMTVLFHTLHGPSENDIEAMAKCQCLAVKS